MTRHEILFVVDDDAEARQRLCAWARGRGVEPRPFAAAGPFLEHYRDEGGCLVADLNAAATGGLDLQIELAKRHCEIPVIMLAGRSDVASVVRAMKNGAFTVLDKPCDDERLWQAVREAFSLDAERRDRRARQAAIRGRLEGLTYKERDVLRMVVAGKANKTIAKQLGASVRTIENRRRSVFAKLGAQSVAELVALVLQNERCADLTRIERL